MTRPPVRNKHDMYRRLERGEFGNQNPGFRTLTAWRDWPQQATYPLWGIRSLRAGDARTVLNVPTAAVERLVSHLSPGTYQISPMVDQLRLLYGEAFLSPWHPCGLQVFGVLAGTPHAGRDALMRHGRMWTGLAAKLVLDHFLWPADRDDLQTLLEDYPGHVVEFTAASRAVGVIPARNTIIWEVRIADGSYEKW